MPLSDKSSHLNSNNHKQRIKEQHVWCEACGKNISDKTRHFQREIHLTNQQNTQSAPGNQINQLDQGVEIIVNRKTNTKLKTNPIENLDYHINELLSKY